MLKTIANVSLTIAFLCLSLNLSSAQDGEQGREIGNYNVKQSVELGYRFTNFTGNSNVYDTFVNLQQGPRLLGFSTEMHSLNKTGSLFDRLFFDNFGYGGDPNDASRLTVSKNKTYDFSAMFRRDQNYWDYSLLANPLNSTTPFANAPAGFTPIISNSPHRFDTVRKMSNFDLTVFPESKLRFRLGYSRNVSDGPSFSSLHEGTEQLLLQDWRNTVNSYHLGVDFKLAPRTNISYDQFLSYYKGDTGYSDQSQLFSLPNGAPVDIGVSLNAGANQPCANTFSATGTINPACSGVLSYARQGQARTSSPTEQISLQSSYFKKLDISARYGYTGAQMYVASWFENFDGRSARTGLIDRTTTAPISGEHIADSADLGTTWHVTDKFSVIDDFHFSNFHNPAQGTYTLCQFFSASLLAAPTVFTPTSPITNCALPPGAIAGTPTHSASSPADQSINSSNLFLKQDEKTNLFELEYQFSPKIGARLGYRFRARTIADSDFESGTFLFYPSLQNGRALSGAFAALTCPASNNLADGSCLITPPSQFDSDEVQIHEDSGVFGLWFRPSTKFRINFDAELMSADNAFTRISPRQFQEYRVRTTYAPASWVNLNGSFNVFESRNNVTQINYLAHNRAYAIAATLIPNSRLSLELGYDYNDIFSQILVCYTSATAPTGLAQCPGSTVLIQQLSTYTNTSHFGYFDFRFTHKAVTARLGTNITTTSGSALLINPNAPSGPLDSKYYQPFGGLEYRVRSNWTGKAYWGYYGYSEAQTNVAQDLLAPRNFRGNMATLSAVYAF
ncbi:MAG TPA: hypothetical protein VN684_11560 [Terriglobales bacterium]|nr:hypothetical protein [Terriglobales bacterium]